MKKINRINNNNNIICQTVNQNTNYNDINRCNYGSNMGNFTNNNNNNNNNENCHRYYSHNQNNINNNDNSVTTQMNDY